MAAYVVRRLAWAAVLLVAVTLNAYVLFFVVPTEDVALGGVVREHHRRTPASTGSRSRAPSLTRVPPLPRAGLAHGDLGQSWRTREDVTEIIGRAAPATASLVIGGADRLDRASRS